MANTAKVLFRGAATTNTDTTLYTVPSSTTTIITDIVVTNTTDTAGTFTIKLDDVSIATLVTIGAYDSTIFSIKQALGTAKTIKGGASETTINFHISGVEIS